MIQRNDLLFNLDRAGRKDCGVGVSSFSFVVAFNVQVYLEIISKFIKHNLVPFFFLLYLIHRRKQIPSEPERKE